MPSASCTTMLAMAMLERLLSSARSGRSGPITGSRALFLYSVRNPPSPRSGTGSRWTYFTAINGERERGVVAPYPPDSPALAKGGCVRVATPDSL